MAALDNKSFPLCTLCKVLSLANHVQGLLENHNNKKGISCPARSPLLLLCQAETGWTGSSVMKLL